MAMARKLLLVCGILAALLYVAMNALVPLLWPGFSVWSQTISELSAIDAPTRSLWVALGAIYGVLLMAFGYGVRSCDRRSRPLRIAGALIIADGVFCLFWPPMHQRAVLAAGGATLTDTLHIAWTMVSGMLMMLSIGCAAAAFDKRFRAFAVATIVLLVAFGALTGTYAASVQANLPTPWLGVWERVDAGLLMLWLIVLAVALLRRGETTAVGIAEEAAKLGGHNHWVPPETSVAFFNAHRAGGDARRVRAVRPRVRRRAERVQSNDGRRRVASVGPSRREEKP